MKITISYILTLNLSKTILMLHRRLTQTLFRFSSVYPPNADLSSTGTSFSVGGSLFRLASWSRPFGRTCFPFPSSRLRVCCSEGITLTIWLRWIMTSRKVGPRLSWFLLGTFNFIHSAPVCITASNASREWRPTKMIRENCGSSDPGAMLSDSSDLQLDWLCRTSMAKSWWTLLQSWWRLKKDGFLQFHSSVSTSGLFILQQTMLWECTRPIPRSCSSWQDLLDRIILRVSSLSRCTVPLKPSEVHQKALELTKSEGKRWFMQKLCTNSSG